MTGRERGRRPSALRVGAVLSGAAAAVALTAGVGTAAERTLEPRPDAPAHVDALLVLYSSPQAYEEALDLLGEGVADRAFVSAHLGPDGHEALCGAPAATDPRLAGVTVECFDPDPVTTQGEVVFAAERMRALGLHDLGVLTFDAHLERARILAQRCWTPEEGAVSMYSFDPGHGAAERVRDVAYGVAAFAKTAVTPGCAQELPGPLQWALDAAKRLRGQPVGAVLGREKGA